MGSMRSAWCGELRKDHVGLDVVLCGWVDGRRDLGGLVFVDVRDRSGIAQVVLNPEAELALEAARGVRAEFAVRVRGEIAARGGSVNPDLPTGEVEVRARDFEVLSECPVPPFVVEDDVRASEELRLKYRFLDLRRPRLQGILQLRHRAFQAGRQQLTESGLLEIETPILFKSTPEGARDYLVPSRVNPGTFYALPQSPQVLKQVLMVSGFDGYFQMARCFRDEDLRANRQPEFTQMDMEISFCTEEDVFRITEGFIAAVWREIGHEVETPLPRLTHAEAMALYGSDKPDVRFGMTFADVTDLMDASSFRVTAGAKERGEIVRCFRVEGGASFSRKRLDELTELARSNGAGGLLWLKRAEGDGAWSGPPVKALAEGELGALADAASARAGDLLLMAAGREAVVSRALCAVRLAVADELGLRPKDTYGFTWVRDFPLFEQDPDTGALAPAHHPFCMPRAEDFELFESNPAAVRARSYDLTCNGEELGSGSIRIHRRDIQSLVFRHLGLSEDEAQHKFGFFLEALAHGAPPHGGIALGMERIIMLLAGVDSLRDVLAFPKTASAADLMADCPSTVSPSQLEELHVRCVTER